MPSLSAANSTYDPDGNLSTFADFNGKTTTYAYDALNRLKTITPDATLTGQTPIGYTFFPTGQRKSMTDASGTTTYAYTARNQLLSKATPQGTLSYTYDAASNVQTLRSSNTNGITVTYGYDELNRLKTVLDNRLTAGANTTTYGYDPDSDLLTTTLPNGVLTNATYDPLDRLTNLTTSKGAQLASYAYTLRQEGNRSQVIETGPSARTVTYGYDNAYRLTSETINIPVGAIGATYDHTGNRLTRSSTIGVIPAASATYDANDRQSGITYDSNGNTTLASGVTYGYDFLNRLTSATGGIALKYDGDGNRVQETVGGVTTNFLVDDNNPTGVPQVVEELVGGVVQRQYTYGHSLISQNQAAGVSFYGMDAQHNVRFLTNAAGAITDQYTYDAFGNAITSSTPTPNSYRFAGEYLDANLGLYYLRARYYNAGTGRFWNRDSAEINPDDPRELNRYVYTADNPVNATDPSGLFAFEYAQQSSESAEAEGAVAEEGGTLAQGAYDNTINDAVGDAVDAVDSTDTNTLEKAQELRIDMAKRSGHWGGQQFAQQYPDIIPKERFSTSQGARIVDFFDKENKIAHEVKTGLQSLSSKVGPEIAKDAELLADGEFKEVIWHFYRSPITGKAGASPAVLDLLAENGIKVIFE